MYSWGVMEWEMSEGRPGGPVSSAWWIAGMMKD